MTDFTVDPLVPTHIHSFTRWVNGHQFHIVNNNSSPVGITWGAANTAVYIPMWLPFPYFAQRAFWVNGATVATNADIGIYTPSGTRLWSIGSTAQSGASAVQYVTISGGMMLSPGAYYLAWVTAGTTTAVTGILPGSAVNARMSGLVQQATALPLPNPATFASISTVAGYPLVGLTNQASGF